MNLPSKHGWQDCKLPANFGKKAALCCNDLTSLAFLGTSLWCHTLIFVYCLPLSALPIVTLEAVNPYGTVAQFLGTTLMRFSVFTVNLVNFEMMAYCLVKNTALSASPRCPTEISVPFRFLAWTLLSNSNFDIVILLLPKHSVGAEPTTSSSTLCKHF